MVPQETQQRVLSFLPAQEVVAVVGAVGVHVNAERLPVAQGDADQRAALLLIGGDDGGGAW